MFTFVINPYFPKAYHRPDHSRRIVEYHRKKLSLNQTFSPKRETRTVIGFVTFVTLISPPKQIALVLALFFIVLSFRATETIFTRAQTQEFFGFLAFVPVTSRRNKLWSFRRSSIVLSSYRNRPHRDSNAGHFSRSFDLAMFSSLSQGISMPSLVQISVSILELKVNIHTHNFNFIRFT
jgi:hypothetical protein